MGTPAAVYEAENSRTALILVNLKLHQRTQLWRLVFSFLPLTAAVQLPMSENWKIKMPHKYNQTENNELVMNLNRFMRKTTCMLQHP